MNDPKSRSKGIFIAPTSLVHEYPFTFQTSTLRHFCIIIQHFHASMHFFSSPGNNSRRRGVCLPLSNDAKTCLLGRSAIAQRGQYASLGARLLPSEGNTPSPLRYCPLGQYALAARLCAHCVARIHRAFSMACSTHSHARCASRKATQFRAIELLSIKDYAQNACKIVGSD